MYLVRQQKLHGGAVETTDKGGFPLFWLWNSIAIYLPIDKKLAGSSLFEYSIYQ